LVLVLVSVVLLALFVVWFGGLLALGLSRCGGLVFMLVAVLVWLVFLFSCLFLLFVLVLRLLFSRAGALRFSELLRSGPCRSRRRPRMST